MTSPSYMRPRSNQQSEQRHRLLAENAWGRHLDDGARRHHHPTSARPWSAAASPRRGDEPVPEEIHPPESDGQRAGVLRAAVRRHRGGYQPAGLPRRARVLPQGFHRRPANCRYHPARRRRRAGGADPRRLRRQQNAGSSRPSCIQPGGHRRGHRPVEPSGTARTRRRWVNRRPCGPAVPWFPADARHRPLQVDQRPVRPSGGDDALVEESVVGCATARPAPTWCRGGGGDEFVVLLRDRRIDEGLTVADKIRGRIADTAFEHFGLMTVSVGAAELNLMTTSDARLACADEALLKAGTARKRGAGLLSG